MVGEVLVDFGDELRIVPAVLVEPEDRFGLQQRK